MNKAQRKARMKELKRKEKDRRKEKRVTEPVQGAPQPEPEKPMETNAKPAFETDEIRNTLREALDVVVSVMRGVTKAIERVKLEEADAVFAERISAQNKRDEMFGVKRDEKTLVRSPIVPVVEALEPVREADRKSAAPD